MNKKIKKRNQLLLLLLVFSFLLFTYSFLLGENNMGLIAELTGEHPRSEFGFHAASLDFNGDGIDDLAVGAHRWDPEYEGWPALANPWGKIYMYFGKEEGFGDSIDFTISCFDSLKNIGNHLENLGDMNDDGYEDLGYFAYYYDPDEDLSHYFAKILLGNAVMDSIPDYTYEFLGSEFSPRDTPDLMWLGDINGDGYDDAGFVISKILENNDKKDWVYLIYGNDFDLIYFAQIGRENTIINGIGDVNNDSFSDFIIGHYIDGTVRKLLFFGGAENDSIPDIILTDIIPNPYYDTTGGIAIGDWNGDGIDDFNSGIDCNGPDIWFGSETTLQQKMHLEFYDWLVNRNNGFGDLNGDGKDDFAAGISGYANGDTYMYLGCQNGTVDYHIEGEHHVGLGWSVTVGDYNNDGYDDVAVGGTGYNASGLNDCWCGKVYMYAGNALLEEADPNIAIDEEPRPPAVPELIAYPNPFNNQIEFEIKADHVNDLKVQIYNIKGQLIKSINVQERNFIWQPKERTSGVYFCRLLYQDRVLSMNKVTFIK